VGMAGDLHLEALAAPDGRVRVYLTDFWRRPLPAASATGTVTLELADGDRTLPLAAAGDALEASGPALPGPEVTARFALGVGGKPVEMDFVLPVRAGGAGAAGVPVHGCVALAGSPGVARAPRCTLDFARPARGLAAPRGVLRSVAWSPDGARLLVTAFYDASAHLVRADDGRELRRFPVEREGAGVAFAPDGKQVAVGSELGSVALYPIEADTPARLPPPTSGPARVLVFPDGRLPV